MLPKTLVCDPDVGERVGGYIGRGENGKQAVLGPDPAVVELPGLLERTFLNHHPDSSP